MKRFTLAIILIFASVNIFAQTVSNVVAGQEGKNVVVSYDIDKASAEVQLMVSTDGGKTFSSPLKKVSGDIKDVQPGHHRIIWDVLAEVEKLSGDNIVFNVVAESEHKFIDGHEYVDLGLSVKWATCNVGASKLEEYGDYFAWGETSPKSNYSWETLKYCTKGDSNKNVKLSKYVARREYGPVDNKTTLEVMDDAAHTNWGGSWRMPTDAEWTELRKNCKWKWTTQNGVKGYKVTSKKSGYTSNSIFLPAAGYRYGDYLGNAGSNGYYWSSSLGTDYSSLAYYVYFGSSNVLRNNFTRYYGLPVRPVSE